MNRKISGSQMAGISLIKNLQALIFVRVPPETLSTNEIRKFNSNNNDSKRNSYV